VSEKLFYLINPYGGVGGNCEFHGESGYTTDLRKCALFTKTDAQGWVDNKRGDTPLLKSEVDKHIVFGVDHQHLNENNLDMTMPCYVQVSGMWNGNDIAFLDAKMNSTFNHGEAFAFNPDEAVKRAASSSNLIAWNCGYINEIARPTFQISSINKRKMITAGGIKLPRKQKPNTGKTRLHCGECHHIFWDLNPYTEVCSRCD
jgi:hypothetical protein